MKSIIRRLLVLLLITILMTTTSFSSTISSGIEKDTIVSITPTQLKETNLIFAEHSKLLKENKLLRNQIANYKEDNRLLIKADSVRVSQLSIYKDWNNSLKVSLNQQKQRLTLWKIGGITTGISLLILLLVK